MHTKDYKTVLTSAAAALSMRGIDLSIADCPIPTPHPRLKQALDAAEQFGLMVSNVKIGDVLSAKPKDQEGEEVWAHISQQPVTAGQILESSPELRTALEQAIPPLKVYYKAIEHIANVAQQAYESGELQVDLVNSPTTGAMLK